MSNQNTQPNTVEPVQAQQKLSTTTQPNPLKSSIKPSQLFTNTSNPANNIVVSNVPKTIGNIFGNSRRPSQNIFAQNDKSKTVNLFSISTVPQTTTTSNIFKTASKPMIATHQDEDEKSQSNGSSQGVRKAQTEFKSLPQKLEMKFKYENPWTVIKLFNLRKFKNGINSSKEHIYLTLERNSQFPDKVYFFVRAKQTKVILFQGFGLKNLTNNITTFMNKEQNLKLTVIKQQQKKEENEEDEFKPQFVKEELKMQFENMEDVKVFREIVGEEFGEKKVGEEGKNKE